MTVAELVKQLQTFPPETKVVVRGYENGYNNILKLRSVRIKPNTNANWYDGEYEDNDSEISIDAIDFYGENQNPKEN